MNSTTIITAAYFENMLSDLQKFHIVKKVKVTSEFISLLKSVCPTTVEDPPKRENIAKGVWGQFTGIPIEIDDTIDSDYKLVY